MHVPVTLNNTTKQCCYVSRWATVQLVVESVLVPRAKPSYKHRLCNPGAALDCVSGTWVAINITSRLGKNSSCRVPSLGCSDV
jgi:hypothetical protein